jgi:nickel-type superoxide dismutase maturation protease
VTLRLQGHYSATVRRYTSGVILSWPLRLVLVSGPSMVPTLRHGDRLVVWLREPRRTPRVGAVVIVDLPGRPLSVKRLVGVDEDGSIRVEGDNEFGSTDSRGLGALPQSSLRGVALARMWPRPGRLPRGR